MVERTRIRLLAGALAAAVMPGLSGCTGPPYAGPPPPPYPPYYYDYYYYPHVDVYFHIYSGYYWYPDGRYWRRVRTLPPHIYLYPRYRVLLRIPDEHPYTHHDEHRRKYPPPPQPRPEPRVPPQAGQQPGQQPGRQPGPPPPQPRLDREEREHNVRQNKEYRKKPWIRPQ